MSQDFVDSEYWGEGAPLSSLPAPLPVPDTATYLAQRERALAFSDVRQANYQKYLASSRRSAEVDYLPVRLDFENVSRCNFRCAMCHVSQWPKGKRADDMPLAEFKRLIDEQVGLVEIKVQGLGEPTLQGDDYFEMIRYARSKELWVRTTTNASLLHLKDNYRKLVDSGVNEIQISIDGADEETFVGIRQGAVFHQVVENCKKINAYCAEKGVELTKMWTVVQKGNRHQLPQLVDLAHEMGFKSMAFSVSLFDFGIDSWAEQIKALVVEDSFTVPEGRQLLERGKNIGVNVAFWSGTDRKYKTDSKEHLCPWPFERGYIASDLRIVPCCLLGNPDVAELGDAKDFNSAWFGAEWKAFRQAHLDGNIPRVCSSCYEGTPS